MGSDRDQRRCGRPVWRLVSAAAICAGIGSTGLVVAGADDDVAAPPVRSTGERAGTAVSQAAIPAVPTRLSGLAAALVEYPRPDVRSIRPATGMGSSGTGSSDTGSSGAERAKGVPWPPDPPALTSEPAAPPSVVATSAEPPIVATSAEPPVVATSAEPPPLVAQPVEPARPDPPVSAAAPPVPRTAVAPPAISPPARRLSPSPPARAGGATGPRVAMPHPRVFVHFSTIAADGVDEARRLSAYLRARGYTVADIRAVSFPIGTAKVRYFFADDAAAARRVTGTFAEFQLGMADRQGPVRMQDYAHFRPLPTKGNVEVWLPSGSARQSS